MKTKTLTCTVVPKSEFTDELKGMADDGDVMGYASVETVDRDNDVVRVAGISLANHRADSPVKLLASHQRVLPNGESPVIGRVTGFKQVTHKGLGVPALAFSAKFAPTPLGRHYKSLYDSGDMTDFSIGFRPTKAEPIKDGGFDYQQSELMEISAVALPANAYAGVMRALEETYPEAKHTAQHEMTVKVDTSDLCDVLKSISDEFHKINLRLDDIEDAIAGSSQAAEQSAGHPTPPSEKSEGEPTPEEIASALTLIRGLRK